MSIKFIDNRRKIAFGLIAALVLVMVGIAAYTGPDQSKAANDPSALLAPAVSSGSTSASVSAFVGPNTIADIAESASAAVVSIETEDVVQTSSRGYMSDPSDLWYYFFFGGQPRQQQQREQVMSGAGSGFIFTEDGYILTNNHVIASQVDSGKTASKITVKLKSGETYEAKVVQRRTSPDVAVIKIDAKNLPTIPLGESSKARLGEWVLAIGNPLDMGLTVTAGIISATSRYIDEPGIAPMDYIQTDAAINPGNSGGPLLNLAGEAIGINSLMNVSGQNIGFAIPIDSIRSILPNLMKESKGGYLGVQIVDVDQETATRMGIPSAGVLIYPMSGQAADKAGLKYGDIIVKIDDTPITTSDDLKSVIDGHSPGDKVVVYYLRSSGSRSVMKSAEVTLGTNPDFEKSK